MRHVELRLHLDLAGGVESCELRGKFAPRRQFVVCATAERLCRIVSPQHPYCFRPRSVGRKARQVDEGAYCRVAGAKDRKPLARVAPPLFSEHIGHTIGDPRGRFDFADCTKAIGPGGIRREPCSGCVYNCIGAQRFWTAPVLVTHHERRDGAMTTKPYGCFVSEDACRHGENRKNKAHHKRSQDGLLRMACHNKRPKADYPGADAVEFKTVRAIAEDVAKRLSISQNGG